MPGWRYRAQAGRHARTYQHPPTHTIIKPIMQCSKWMNNISAVIRHVFCVYPCSPTLIIILPPHAHNHWLWQLTKEKPERMHKLTTFCTKADISWNTRSSSLLSRSGSVDHGRVDHSLDPSFTIFQPCFWLRKWLECDTCTFDRVSFVWLTLAIATIPFSCCCFSAMSNTANWPLAVSGTEACQTTPGLVKTRGTSLCCGTRLAEI